MRNLVSANRSRFLGRAAIAAILAASVAGCAESSRFGQPLFTGSTTASGEGVTANQRAIIAGQNQDVIPGGSSGAIARNDLPPPTYSSGPTYPSSAPTYSSGPDYSTPGPVASAGPAPTGASGGDYVWTPEGLKPAGGSAAPAAAYAPASQPSPAAGAAHVVASGDTLYSLGRRYGVSPSEIAAANGLGSSGSIRVGQSLKIPGADGSIGQSQPMPQVASAPVRTSEPATQVAAAGPGYLTHPAGSAPTAQPPVASVPPIASSEPRVIPGVPSVPSIPVETKAGAPVIPASTTAAVDDSLDPPSADGTSFRWPVRGRIISGFGGKPNGEKNDGINLAVPEGTTVKAAEAGTVIYAGNELEGYGQLVLIRHADDWVSAYAHNSAVKVKKGDKVSRGQTIATAGMTGSVTSPQVHFELRKKAKPVNPLDYLAGA